MILGKRLALLFLFCATVARADGFSFNPATVNVGDLMFDYTAVVPNSGLTQWLVVVEDTSAAGADFYGYCYDHPAPIYAGCDDGPVAAFEPAGAPAFDIATVIFGYDPGLVYPPDPPQTQAAYITTPEPPTWLLVLPIGLLIGLKRLLWKG